MKLSLTHLQESIFGGHEQSSDLQLTIETFFVLQKETKKSLLIL